MKKIYVIGTFDTKSEELAYVTGLIRKSGADVKTLDVSSKSNSDATADISNAKVAASHPKEPDFLDKYDDRGKAVALMSEALCEFLLAQDDVGAVIGLGGSGNTALVTAAMRVLPIGLPKLMVSTVASGDVSPYVGPNDITMMYSVTDVAGLNKISRLVLGNAAHAISGMIRNKVPQSNEGKELLGMTMFGVTTPCVTAVKKLLEAEFEPLIFHATGTGGMSLEKLIDSGMIRHVIDSTLTEVCDLFMGGVMSAGEDRLGSIIRQAIPYVGSVGALDMVNFAAINTIPEKYKGRNFYEHNANVTLMRTTKEENEKMGTWIGKKINLMSAPVRFLLPEKGVSMIDAEGQPFYDSEADEALFQAIEKTVSQSDTKKVIRLPYHINDPEFSAALVKSFREICT